MPILDFLKQVAELGYKGGLALLVYVLAKDAVRTRVALIECLQSGGKLSEKSLDQLDELG